MTDKDNTPKESNSEKQQENKQEIKEEIKEDIPKEEIPKEEMPKEEISKEEIPKKEISKEEIPKEVKTEEEEKKPSKKEKRVILHADAYKTIILYATRYANNSIPREQWREIYGVLIGHHTEDAVVIERAEPMTYGESTDVELTADHYGFIAEIQDKLDMEEGNRFLVGWFHSHPGLSLFYSWVDIKNQIGFQGPNTDSIGLVFDHTYLLNKKNHPGFEIFRLNDPEMSIDDPKFDTNYHPVEYEIIGLNEFFFANVLSELSAYVAAGNPLQKAYKETETKKEVQEPLKSTVIPQIQNKQQIINNQQAIMKQAQNIMSNFNEQTQVQKQKSKNLIFKESEHERDEKDLELSQIPGALSAIPGIGKPQVLSQDEHILTKEEKLKEAEKYIFQGKTSFLINDSFGAIENYNTAIDILSNMGEENNEKILDTFFDISEACLKSDHDNLASEYADKLKNKAEAMGDLFHMGNADYIKGNLLIKKGEFQQALEVLQNAAILYEKAGDFAGAGKINENIATIKLKEEDYETACLFMVEGIKGYKAAIKKFHPKRKSTWSLPANLTNMIENLKTQISEYMGKIGSEEIREKIRNDLKDL